MGGFSSIDEILEFAIAREVEAHAFYMSLADRVDNPAMGELILEFAKEELQHKANLELEVMKSGKVVVEPEKLTDFDISNYLGDIEYRPDMDYKDLLLLAIDKEKMAFRLYVVLAGMADDKDAHNCLISLAEEEARHKALFEIEYNEVASR